MSKHVRTKDAGSGRKGQGSRSAPDSQDRPREGRDRRTDVPGFPPADERAPAEGARAEPSEDFAQRDIETADESPEQHDRRRHDRPRGGPEPSQPV